MRGDEGQLALSGGDDVRERSGPRHAAPRKSLLTKLHIPASKAIALAAMPTAVFVGMSLTPKLAMADDDIPFAAGPCVTASDSPSATPSGTPKPSDSATPSPSPSSDASGAPGDTATPSPSASPSGTGTKPAASTTSKSAAAAATPSPSATKSTNPLDPLGVGDALKDLLGIKDTPSPTASATTPAPTPSKSSSTSTPSKKPTDPVTDGVKKTVDDTTKAIKDAADKAGKTVEDLPKSAQGLDAKKDTDIPDGAKPSYPCPTADPKALAAADLETGIPDLPSDPWTLKTSMLTLSGLDYKGIVEVKTADGKIKKVLKFTASSLDIKNLHQLVVGPNGTTAHVQARDGSTSTIRDGQVTMYTESLKGNLFGLIPITFSPATPPPVNVPFAFFTNVTVVQAGQFGGTLTVPGLHNYFTQN
ncbi:hypothetical protein [Streptomyces beijiangensis]|uniref:Hydrogenase expression protein HypF n=1 Tax=Streptomyces beijiangensis TaxID=163361 RepID=A0A939FAZ1_9ACTN|nr:hypothetical protein [Streptomyces beijiangensis]MBO0514137.1 hypothetical protein [Streptomyces beijiangensis]